MGEISSQRSQTCVFLWALPRSASTAFAKCMSYVDGIQVWNEPYQFCYHNERVLNPDIVKLWPKHDRVPKKEKETSLSIATRGKMTDQKMFRYPWVQTQLETQDKDKQIVFVKDIAHLMHGKYEFLPRSRRFRHTFLIRDPRRVYPSFRKMISDIIPESYKEKFDLRLLPVYEAEHIYQYTHELWQYTKKHLDPKAIIIDSGDLLAHPELLLPKYFDAIGVPYNESYLKWDPNADITAQWKGSFEAFIRANDLGIHKTTMHSSCFEAETRDVTPVEEMTPDVIKCIEGALPFYNKMYEQRIKP